MTLANRITILRIGLIPVFVVSFLQERGYPVLKNWTLAIFAFAILTDILDGMAARLRREKTMLGSFLDPLADKLLLTVTFILLTYTARIALWQFVVLFSRDLIIVLGWTLIYILTSSSKIEPRILGKLTTFFQMAAAISLLFPVPDALCLWTVRITIAFTVASAIDYLLVGSKRLELTPG